MAISTGAAILASTLASAAMTDRGSSRAADAQRDAAGMSTAEQRRQFDAMMERSQPFYEGSLNAYNSLLTMEGLPTVSAPAPQQRPSLADMYQSEANRFWEHMNQQNPNMADYKKNQRLDLHMDLMGMGRPSITSSYDRRLP